MASNTIFNSASDEKNWVVEINELLCKTDLLVLNQIPVCIYHVPKSLSSAKPEAFLPQLIAVGPYNHFRPELYPMERFKILSAKRVLNHFDKGLNLENLASKLGNSGPYLRACYHKYLDLEDETLLYVMAIDGLFMLDLLHSYLQQDGSRTFFVGLQQLAPGVKLTKDAIIRDVIMLENQIPIHTIWRIISILQSSTNGDSIDKELGSIELGSMLLSFCEEHSPFEICNNIPTSSEALKHHHLLDLLYHLIVPQEESTKLPSPKPAAKSAASCQSSATGNKIKVFIENLKIPVKWTLSTLGKVKDFNFSLMKPLKKPIEVIRKICNLQLDSKSTNSETEASAMTMAIPSVSELNDIGVKFQPANGGIRNIEFDDKKGIFYLPAIKLDINSEVIIRNMVAYEALTKSRFIFTRYTELMRGIIDTVEDVQLLKKANVISKASTLSEEESEVLFNGMSKSIRPTKTPHLDETIKKVNKYYNDTRKVKAYRLMSKYVYSSWKIFTLLATLVLLGMTALQTFCSAYDCPRLLKTAGSSRENFVF